MKLNSFKYLIQSEVSLGVVLFLDWLNLYLSSTLKWRTYQLKELILQIILLTLDLLNGDIIVKEGEDWFEKPYVYILHLDTHACFIALLHDMFAEQFIV